MGLRNDPQLELRNDPNDLSHSYVALPCASKTTTNTKVNAQCLSVTKSVWWEWEYTGCQFFSSVILFSFSAKTSGEEHEGGKRFPVHITAESWGMFYIWTLMLALFTQLFCNMFYVLLKYWNEICILLRHYIHLVHHTEKLCVNAPWVPCTFSRSLTVMKQRGTRREREKILNPTAVSQGKAERGHRLQTRSNASQLFCKPRQLFVGPLIEDRAYLWK